MSAGHSRPGNAMSTVTIDTLFYRGCRAPSLGRATAGGEISFWTGIK